MADIIVTEILNEIKVDSHFVASLQTFLSNWRKLTAFYLLLIQYIADEILRIKSYFFLLFLKFLKNQREKPILIELPFLTLI